jgi:hypothetical protein
VRRRCTATEQCSEQREHHQDGRQHLTRHKISDRCARARVAAG